MTVVKIDTKILTYDTVNLVLKTLKCDLSKQPTKDLVLDLSDVSNFDSAGVALLVELKRLSLVKFKKNLLFRFSNQILQLVTFYELNDLLELA
ncbi:MAG: STAS domain-containing protein [Gammaproteobacteria bacterium]|nr:STAS domain-containing protein [Gammaproteobacteria bacterium]